MAVTKKPSSFSLRIDTLDELHTLAERKGISASKIVQAAVEQHLRSLRAAQLGGGSPPFEFSTRRVDTVGPTPDASTVRHMQFMDPSYKLPRQSPPSPYRIAACFLDFEEKPLTDSMAEQLREQVERQVALLWLEENTRNGNGA